MKLLATNEQRVGPGSGGITGRGWKPGQSGNAAGRPKSPVDIAALARKHGPKCIEVCAALLDDPDSRMRLSAAIALMDRGFGRPTQTVDAADASVMSITIAHLLGARAASQMLDAQRVIEGDAVANETTTTPPDLMAPAVE